LFAQLGIQKALALIEPINTTLTPVVLSENDIIECNHTCRVSCRTLSRFGHKTLPLFSYVDVGMCFGTIIYTVKGLY